MSNLIEVTHERCTVCGACVRSCPIGLLQLGENGPHTDWDACIACGHCVSSCPREALTHRDAPLARQAARQTELDPTPAQAMEFLRARRSVRAFLDKPVEQEKLEHLLDAGRYAPSGGNTQGVSWLVIRDAATRRAVTETCVAYMEEWFTLAPDTPMTRALRFLVNRFHTESRDVVLWGAPCLVVTMADMPESPVQRDSAVMALLYTQLFAPTLGLGTCWAGLVEYALRGGSEALGAVLKIPAGKRATGAMMVGYPRDRHYRLPERNPLNAVWR